jgi:hypothetical protein
MDSKTSSSGVVLSFPAQYPGWFQLRFRAQFLWRTRRRRRKPLAACISTSQASLASIPRWGRQLGRSLSRHAGHPAAVTLAAALVMFALLLTARLALLAVLSGGAWHE